MPPISMAPHWMKSRDKYFGLIVTPFFKESRIDKSKNPRRTSKGQVIDAQVSVGYEGDRSESHQPRNQDHSSVQGEDCD